MNTDDSKTRLYFMVSTNADGTQNVVPAKLDAENDTLSFEATGNGKVTLVTTDVPYFEEVGTELVTSASMPGILLRNRATRQDRSARLLTPVLKIRKQA